MNKNFLLGRGERLTEDISIRTRGIPKEPIYSIEESLKRLTPRIREATNKINELPLDACPSGYFY